MVFVFLLANLDLKLPAVVVHREATPMTHGLRLFPLAFFSASPPHPRLFPLAFFSASLTPPTFCGTTWTNKGSSAFTSQEGRTQPIPLTTRSTPKSGFTSTEWPNQVAIMVCVCVCVSVCVYYVNARVHVYDMWCVDMIFPLF